MRNTRIRPFWSGYSVPAWHDLERLDAVLYRAFNGDAGGTFALEDDLVIGGDGIDVQAPSTWANVVGAVVKGTFTMTPAAPKVVDINAGGKWRFTGQSPSTSSPKMTLSSASELHVNSGGEMNVSGSSWTIADGATGSGPGTTNFLGLGVVEVASATDIDADGTVIWSRLDIAAGTVVTFTPGVSFSAIDAEIKIRQDANFSGSATITCLEVIRRGRLRPKGDSAQSRRRLTTISSLPGTANTDYDVYRLDLAAPTTGHITLQPGTVQGQTIRFVDLGLAGPNEISYRNDDGEPIGGSTFGSTAHYFDFVWTDAAGWVSFRNGSML